ncbi:MAG: hypothetical protein AVDCRST_MAG08-3224 [uncultured Acetobacteraceae bacterium]|uniref:Uncharacterized protein n=1 Tax=uncultured Acetobacteraceae bacterium TaxID=169975 RepID=A0A6J4J9J3_9PROT|nr:MAG: hypothetical protein AVDCRST_MAG08-3224 [uncultured Acetobacteraceae bacterium]
MSDSLAACPVPGAPGRAGPLASPQAVALACLTVGLSALALPVALVRVPPLLDYPNHLARLWLLGGGIDRPPLSAMYAADWGAAWTNIGADLLAAALGRLGVGGDVVAPLLLVAALVLPPLGAALLNRAVFGGWHWWQAGFAVLAFNSTVLAGFLSFQVGLGLALLAAAADPAIGRRFGAPGGVAARVALCSALLVFHAFAAAFYAALLAALAFGAERAPFGPAVLRSVRAAGPALGVPLAVFVLAAPTLPGGHTPLELGVRWAGYGPAEKLTALLSAIVTYDAAIDFAVVLALWGVGRVASSASMLRVHAGLLFAALGLLALALVLPSSLGGTAFVDWRFPIMALLVAVAALRPGLRGSRGPALAACLLLLLALGRTAWIAGIWHERQSDVAAVERALELVPAGAAVLPAHHTLFADTEMPRGRRLAVGLPVHWHYQALAVPRRAAFVPTLFTAPGKQPLRVRAPWDSIAVLEGVPAPAHFLRSFASTPGNLYDVGYASDWRARFDYVLLLNADMPDAHGGMPALPELELLFDEGFARLYRVRRGPADLPIGGGAGSDPSGG